MMALRWWCVLVLAGVSPVRAADRVVYAPVLAVTPVFATRVTELPVQRCETRTVREPAQVSPTGAILGGIVGAAIGNGLGHAPVNRQVGAVAGGMLGASVGHDIASHGAVDRYGQAEFCDRVYESHAEQQVIGYDVRYQWEGQVWETRTRSDPGPSLRLRVNAEPWE